MAAGPHAKALQRARRLVDTDSATRNGVQVLMNMYIEWVTDMGYS